MLVLQGFERVLQVKYPFIFKNKHKKRALIGSVKGIMSKLRTSIFMGFYKNWEINGALILRDERGMRIVKI